MSEPRYRIGGPCLDLEEPRYLLIDITKVERFQTYEEAKAALEQREKCE